MLYTVYVNSIYIKSINLMTCTVPNFLQRSVFLYFSLCVSRVWICVWSTLTVSVTMEKVATTTLTPHLIWWSTWVTLCLQSLCTVSTGPKRPTQLDVIKKSNEEIRQNRQSIFWERWRHSTKSSYRKVHKQNHSKIIHHGTTPRNSVMF